ncbi:hypothetical protein OG535_39980 [Kitasatospora sp. NBC_00085]|uniref:hypothetical protein n=1 Tax=unclassified Kitasatospora TaxID=2633591 RepID=UPI00324BE2FA
MSDHFHRADDDGLPSLPLPVVPDLLSGQLMIPAAAVTLLLRAIAAGWTACPCDDTDCRWTAARGVPLVKGPGHAADVEGRAARRDPA